jgi:hypothetical protein
MMIAYQVPIGGYRRQQARHHGRVAAAGQGDGQMVDETDGQNARQKRWQTHRPLRLAQQEHG